jgi:hypothetical protein
MCGGGSNPVQVLILVLKWDLISIPIAKPDWNQAQITKSTQVTGQDGLNCQNNKQNGIHWIAVKKIHVRASPSPHPQKNSFILEWNMV